VRQTRHRTARRTRPLNVVPLVAACVAAAATSVRAELVIDRNTTIAHDIHTDVRVVQGSNPSPPTVLEMVERGYVERTVYLHDASVLRLSGGHIHDSLYGFDRSVAHLLGGTVVDTVHAEGASVFNISGGTLQDYVHADDAGRVTVTGGTLWGANARGEATITITGGAFRAFPQEYTFRADESGAIVLHGTGFNYPYGRIPDTAGVLTGLLSDGQPLTADFQTFANGSIILVPEPGSSATVLIAAAVVAPLASRRRTWARDAGTGA
jgi:hypothetical protein